MRPIRNSGQLNAIVRQLLQPRSALKADYKSFRPCTHKSRLVSNGSMSEPNVGNSNHPHRQSPAIHHVVPSARSPHGCRKPIPCWTGRTRVSPLVCIKRNEHRPHARTPRRATMPRQIKANGKALSGACSARLSGLPDARCSRWRAREQAERKLSAWRSHGGTIGLWKLIKSLR